MQTLELQGTFKNGQLITELPDSVRYRLTEGELIQVRITLDIGRDLEDNDDESEITLEEVVARIKARGPTPSTHITPAKKKMTPEAMKELLAMTYDKEPEISDSEWLAEMDRIEAEQKQLSLIEEEKSLEQFRRDVLST